MGFLRNTIAIAFVATLLFYFASVGEMEETQQWITIGVMVTLGLIYILSSSPSFELPAQPVASSPSGTKIATSKPQEETVVEETPVTNSNPDTTMSLKQRKAAKIQAAKEAQIAAMAATNGDGDVDMEDLPIVEVETVHVADEYVVEVSPESIEEADIQATVKERSSRHDEIRARIEARRRSQMADIRASTSRLWEENAVREDLVGLLQNDGHGMTVLDEPLQPESGHIYGATFIRIDDHGKEIVSNLMDDHRYHPNFGSLRVRAIRFRTTPIEANHWVLHSDPLGVYRNGNWVRVIDGEFRIRLEGLRDCFR